ncbi:Transcriptional regulatory protein, C terminal [Lentzea albida]|uniref:Transcriptional regulatory protein, C terminal n=1 Tax=Lentzea albida TaxID=65499 RepID=A0A1H9T496_9PSEU|nr:Transcriptional regulatory protein, C terminal [Lentzea albida]
MVVQYRVLGALEVTLDGADVPVPVGRCRVLLAALLLRPNRFVSVDELAELVWDGAPPARARQSLHQVVRRLRVALGEADCVRTLSGGYEARVGPDELDLLRFRELVAAQDFAAAVKLRRGPLLTNVVSELFHRNEVRHVAEECAEVVARSKRPVPRLLPAAMPRFVGRDGHLRRLTSLAEETGPVIATITGTAGVGKSVLAVQWAHSTTDRFPDGQLHVNMRGFDRHRDPMPPGDVLNRFLEALGVLVERIPEALDDQVALYREMTADRRLLVVLDNVRDADHVRPLLTGPSFVLITSRDRLTGLAGRDVALDVLSAEEARTLLVSRLGEKRVDTADDLVAWCGGLPLALAIVAARAAEVPHLPLSALAADLADERTRLDSLDTGDAETSVRTVFQWSYQRLSPQAARMFRLVGLHPGPDLTIPAATSLAGEPADDAVRELVGANLLVEHAPGRFTCHDLLRVYAADRAQADEPEASRAAAVERMLDHYLHTLECMNRTHYWNHLGTLEEPPVPSAGTTPEVFERPDEAEAWFHAERAVIYAVVVQAGDQGYDRHTWQLVWFMTDLVERFGLWREWIGLFARTTEVVERLGDRLQVSRFVFLRAVGHGRLGELERGVELFEAADLVCAEIGLVPGRVRAQAGIAWLLGELDRPHEAVEVARRSLALLRGFEGRTPTRMRMALYQLSGALVLAGRHAEVLELGAEWESLDGVADPHLSGQMASELARAYIGLGRHAEAVAELLGALESFEQMGTWVDVAYAENFLGDAHLGLGDAAEARVWWEKAAARYAEHEHSDEAAVRAKLASVS